MQDSRRQRPLRPARSLDDFRILFTGNARLRHGSRDYIDSPDFWPCIECQCGGRVLVPTDGVELTLSINGQKLPKEKCKTCGGKGEGTKEAVKALYDEEIRKYRAALTDYQETTKVWRKAIAKLSREERRAIQRFGFPVYKRRGVNVWTI